MAEVTPHQLPALLATFGGGNLGQTLRGIEQQARGVDTVRCGPFLDHVGASFEALAAAGALKRLAAQVNVTIHALGILRCLPHILEPGETVQYVSLGAGNTGRAFDLETDRRLAEFKFIHWKGGAEAIRQNGIFKDYFMLAHSGSPKRKYLYVLDDRPVLKFLAGGRAITSVTSHNAKIRQAYAALFTDRYRTVGDYYGDHHGAVIIQDVALWLPELADGGNDDERDADSGL